MGYYSWAGIYTSCLFILSYAAAWFVANGNPPTILRALVVLITAIGGMLFLCSAVSCSKDARKKKEK